MLFVLLSNELNCLLCGCWQGKCVTDVLLMVVYCNQVSALVTLYSHLGDISSAVDVLDAAVDYAQKNKVC